MMAAMRGAGVEPRRMREHVAQMHKEKLFSQIDYRTLLGFAYPKLATPGIGSALKRPQRLHAFYRRIFGDRRLEELRPRTLLQTADCLSGEGVVLNAGPLTDAVSAASAMAPEFPPFPFEGRWLVDGSYLAPVPIMEAVKQQADVIITLFHEEEPRPHPADLIEANYNILAAYFSRLAKDQTMLAIEMHHHEIILAPIKFDRYIGPWETAALPKVLETGERAVARRKDEILRIVRDVAGGVQ